jgi:hypothetical protein
LLVTLSVQELGGKGQLSVTW